MGHRADWKQCSVKLVDFLSRRLSSTFDGMDEESYAYLRVYQFFSK